MAKMRDSTHVPTSLFRFSIFKDEYDSLIRISALRVLRLPCWVRKQPTNRVISALDEQSDVKNTYHKVFLPKLYVGIGRKLGT